MDLVEILREPHVGLEMSRGRTFPAWYRLKFVEPSTIVFLVHKSVKEWFDLITPFGFASAVGYLDEFCFQDFTPPNDSFWGYEQTIKTVESGEPSWISYEIEIPENVREGDFVITESGYRRAELVAASISILARALYGIRPRFITPGDLPQILTLETSISKGRGISGMPMGAFYSSHVAVWAAMNKNDHYGYLEEIARAMRKADAQMFPNQYSDLLETDIDLELLSKGPFCAWVHDSCYLILEASPQVSLYCDGSSHKDSDLETGYGLDMHNPDSLTQQLTLIAGVARLYELVELDFLSNK